MAKHIKIVALISIVLFIIISGCRNNSESPFRRNILAMRDSLKSVIDSIDKPTKVTDKEQVIKIYGDTVWVRSYASTVWYDSVSFDDFEVYMSVWVDTTDYIVDTVISSKGRRIVIGYNHFYNLRFLKKGSYLFSIVFNKKEDLKNMLSETDFWLESNIDVFQHCFFNKKYNKFIVDYAINPRYNYGALYYFVINEDGCIEYSGIGGSWGGGDPDGEPFLTGDQELFVTAYELYSFKNRNFVDVSHLSFLPNSGIREGEYQHLSNIHAYKPLTDSTFLMIFNRTDLVPEYNAYILKTDTTIMGKFKYYGIMEEMDAVLFFEYQDELKAYYLYDTERKTLISIEDSADFSVKEYPIRNVSEIESDTLRENHTLNTVNFETFGSFKFYINDNDSLVYYDIEKFD